MGSTFVRKGVRLRTARVFAGLIFALTAFSATELPGATFGTVIPIGGHASDLALDEGRGLVYVANFTANRIDVISMASKSRQTSISVAPQPGSIAISPDGQYLVVAHYGNLTSPSSSSNIVTLIKLGDNSKQTFAMAATPLTVAFGADNKALIVTMQDFQLFDPETGLMSLLDTVEGVTAKALPVPSPSFPPEITRASAAASGNGKIIYGTMEAGGEDQAVVFTYYVDSKFIDAPTWTATPPLGPRVVSVGQEGYTFMTGWGLFAWQGYLLAQFRNASGIFNLGSHEIDSARGLIYAEFNQATEAAEAPVKPTSSEPLRVTVTAPPVLLVLESDNLTVRDRIRLPEHLAGKSLLTANGDVMYSVSDSGIMILPVGQLASAHRVMSAQEDVAFRGTFCDRRVMSQEIDIVNPGGGRTEFSLVPQGTGVTVSPTSGTTPARVRVMVDPSAFQNQKGTAATAIEIRSASAVNIPDPIRVLVNNREPDQRGTFVNVPGKIADVLADPVRNRFYVLRQDKNQVLVFDGDTYEQIGILRTGNTPTQIAMTRDNTYLLVGNDDSQIANVHNLDTLTQEAPIVFPSGHYPRSIAASGGAILAASRVAGPAHTIDRIDFATRSAMELPSLGVWENKIDEDTVLSASPSGGSILAAQANGTVLLYEASGDTFTIARQDYEKLSGAFGALSDEMFVVDNNVLNASLVPVQTLETGTGASSGFNYVDNLGLRTTSSGAANPGVVQRVDLNPENAGALRSTRMIEAPLVGDATFGFTRTLAPLANHKAIVALSTSGFTVLPWEFDAAVAEPRIDGVTNAADRTQAVAPGGLITLSGQDLSLVNAASSEVPLPTALGDSCLTINGVLVPMIMVSPNQINAQLPFNVSGPGTALLRTPAGVSNSYRFEIQPTAPSVFRTGWAGPNTGLATVVRLTNNQFVTLSNPIHPEDWVVIYLTGMGQTSPSLESGAPGPMDPLAQVTVPPVVTLGNTPLNIGYAGMAPTQVGVYQINAFVPYWVPLGTQVPLRITQGSASTTLDVRVVK